MKRSVLLPAACVLVFAISQPSAFGQQLKSAGGTAMMPKAAAIPAAPQSKAKSSGDTVDWSRHWEVEVHGGGIFGGTGGAGSGSVPQEAPTAASANVSSWMFGAGTAHYNSVASGFSGFIFTQSIVPLDSMLTRNALDREMGGNVGLRVSRDLNRHVSLEFSADFSNNPLRLTDRALGAINTTISSFQASFSEPTGFFGNPSPSTSTVLHRSDGGQAHYIGSVNFNLKTEGKFIPYITLGGGIEQHIGGAPRATLFGSYEFNGGNTPEGDIVGLNYHEGSAGVFAYGIGGKYYFSPHWGVRVEGRGLLAGNNTKTLLSTDPQTTTTGGSATTFSSPGGTLRFSSLSGIQTDLSGAPLNHVATFKGSGSHNEGTVNIGLLYRF